MYTGDGQDSGGGGIPKAPKPYVEPVWLSDGAEVWIPWNLEQKRPGYTKQGIALRCTVICAAGNHARIGNESRSVDKWCRLRDLLVPPDSPYARYGG